MIGRMSNVALVLISAAIGAGGAIAAQSISSYFSSRHDTKRFDWERSAQNREWQVRERERFLDLKRDLYSNFAFEVSKLMAHTHALNYPSLGESPAPVSLEELRKLQWNIDLIAPEALGKSVSDSLLGLIAAYETAGSDHVTHDRKVADADAAEREWWKTYALLREDLLVSAPQVVPSAVAMPTAPWWRNAIKKTGRLNDTTSSARQRLARRYHGGNPNAKRLRAVDLDLRS